MAEKEQRTPARTLEMRVAELEDKLRQMHITEDEMRAYNKVASAMVGGAVSAEQLAKIPGPKPCIASCVINPCIITNCVICYCIRECIQECVRGCIRDVSTEASTADFNKVGK